MLANRRQLSLDETGKRRLRRQSSNDIKPILAWQDSLKVQGEKQQNQVEVVAKKIGQPKPAPTRPIRSPSIRKESTLTISRRQVTERLKAGWNKAIAKEGQGNVKDKGRQNLNIFLNKSFEARPDSPRTPELGNGFRRCQSLYNENDENIDSDSSSESESEEEEKKLLERKDTVIRAPSLQESQRPVTSQPSPSHQPPAIQAKDSGTSDKQRLSASARRAVFRTTGRQQPTTNLSPETSRPQRLMSAPPQATRPPMPERSRSAPLRRRQQRKPRRGVEGGEVVTMVSLVSPAQSDEEEAIVCCPPTPEVPSLDSAPSPSPPMILSLRRPPKAVTFKASVEDGFRTNYPTKQPTILQEDPDTVATPKVETPSQVSSNKNQRPLIQKLGKPQNALPSKSKPPLLQKQMSKQAAEKQERLEELKRCIKSKIQEPIKEEQTVEGSKSEEDKISQIVQIVEEDETKDIGDEVEQEFKSAKERECWQLFKRMSSRGISVSFETVLRGLLTPTEYRMRRSALMASC